MEALLRIDRRYIFLLLFLALAVTSVLGGRWKPTIEASGQVKAVYQALEDIGSKPSKVPGRTRPAVLVSMDFDPPSSPELGPMTKAVLRQLFRKQYRVIGMTHWPSGLALTKGYMSEVASEFDDVVVGYRFAPSAAEAKRIAADREKAAQEVADAAKAAAGQADEAARTRALARASAAWLGAAEGATTVEEKTRRIALTAEGWARVERAGPQKLRAMSRADRGGFLVDAHAYADNVAAFVPGLLEVTASRGEPLAAAGAPADPALHAALATAKPGTAKAVKLGDGRHAVVEVLARFEALEYAKDYCYLGMKPGQEILMVSMGQSIYDSFPTDTGGMSTRSMEILADVPTLREIDYLIALAAGDSGEKWIQYGHEKFQFPMSLGCTAVMAPDLYPYLQAKQIDGIVGGIRGAWEYEKLVGIPGDATTKVPVQTTAHLLVILLIVICNVGYLLSPKGKRS